MLKINFDLPNNKPFKIFASAGKSAVTICFAIFLLFILKNEYREFRITELNYFMPRSYSYLRKIAENQEKVDDARLRRYEHYYQLLVKGMPHKADAHGMVGFCSYHLGKRKESILSYKKAIELNSHFFWFHYNLGLIYFKGGNYKKAAASFRKAAETNPDNTLIFIRSSQKIYLPIILENSTEPKESITAQLKISSL